MSDKFFEKSISYFRVLSFSLQTCTPEDSYGAVALSGYSRGFRRAWWSALYQYVTSDPRFEYVSTWLSGISAIAAVC